MFIATQTFPPERSVLMKERSSGTYRLSAYLTAKSVAEFPLLVLMVIYLQVQPDFIFASANNLFRNNVLVCWP